MDHEYMNQLSMKQLSKDFDIKIESTNQSFLNIPMGKHHHTI